MNILSQMRIAEIKQKKNYIIILIILLSWAHQWLSIGSFINTDYKNFTLNYILQYRNQSLAIFVINLFIFFFNNTKKIKNNIFFYFCLIPATYLLGLVNLFIDTPSEKDIYFFWHFTFILQMINTLLIINRAFKNKIFIEYITMNKIKFSSENSFLKEVLRTEKQSQYNFYKIS
jgi:hypothetical protein